MIQKFMRLVTGWMLMGSMLLSGTSGMVLCIGDEDHVMVESAHHDHCAGSHNADFPGHEDAAYPDIDDSKNCTRACVDVPLAIDTASLSARPLKVGHLFGSLSVDTMLADYPSPLFADTRAVVRPPSGAMLRLAPSLLEKRTIVLRI